MKCAVQSPSRIPRVTAWTVCLAGTAWSGGLNGVASQMCRLRPREGKDFPQDGRAQATSGRVLSLVSLSQPLAWPGSTIWAE